MPGDIFRHYIGQSYKTKLQTTFINPSASIIKDETKVSVL
jgi:hypothetical protein